MPCRRPQQEGRHLGSRLLAHPTAAPSPGANPVPRHQEASERAPSLPGLASPNRAPLPLTWGRKGAFRGGRARWARGRSALSSSVESLRAGESVRTPSACSQAAWEPAQHAACGGHAPARAHTHPHVAHEAQAPWDAARLPHTAQAPHSRGPSEASLWDVYDRGSSSPLNPLKKINTPPPQRAAAPAWALASSGLRPPAKGLPLPAALAAQPPPPCTPIDGH